LWVLKYDCIILITFKYLKINSIKKLLTLIAVLFITAPAYAQETINVNVKKDDSYSDKVKANAAETTAKAALAKAMLEPSTVIKIPIEVDFNNFTTIALVGIGNIGGIFGPKLSYKAVAKALEFSPITVMNPIEENKKKFKKNKMFLRETKDPNWLYVYVKFSMSGVNSIKSLVIRDSKNKVLYSVSHTNVPLAEVMSPLVDF
jgi:hypothetical protein